MTISGLDAMTSYLLRSRILGVFHIPILFYGPQVPKKSLLCICLGIEFQVPGNMRMLSKLGRLEMSSLFPQRGPYNI